MSNELPPLPTGNVMHKHEDVCGDEVGPPSFYFTADQMRDYARAAVLAEREACAVVAWTHYMDECSRSSRAPAMWHEWCAATAIRARSTK